MPSTLFDKIWDSHVVARRADGKDLLYMDRNVVDEVRAPIALGHLDDAGRTVRRTDLAIVVQDHTVSTETGRSASSNPATEEFIVATRTSARKHGIRLFDIGDPEQGISHVVAPELGLALPGATYACADSHAPTVGGVGALGFGCGNTELEHVLATQTMALEKPKVMRIRMDGRLDRGVTAKDAMMHVIGKLGVDGGRSHAVELTGPVPQTMAVEGRMTMCNMAVEMGARSALVQPDDAVFQYLNGRPFAPQDADWDAALEFWRTLRSDDDARYDREAVVDCSGLAPQISWGTDPSLVIPVTGRVPDASEAKPDRQAAWRRALEYMGLTPGMSLDGIEIHRVFIGSCTNSRLSDLQSAAEVARGRHVAPGVLAVIVPGSTSVKREAEALGLDRIFRDAGFRWDESGCSMCAGGNGDVALPGQRVVSTTNRNFESRQGRDVRTHLASPAMAAAAAVSGKIVDVRRLLGGA
jgi:3-isopropylmalate/(R)-2-methylmalate dehydratase large subunit